MTTPRQSLAAATLHGTVFALGGANNTATLASVEAFDLAAGAHWTLLAASMTTPRYLHAAAVLRGLIYAAGGSPDHNLASVERFDGGAHSTWALVASMGTKRALFALVALEEGGPSHHGGMLVAAGGTEDTSAEAYDPVADEWAPIANMATARSGCAGAALGGKAYVSGGQDSNNAFSSVEVFDPATGKWAAAPPMGTARMSHAAAALVVGGTARIYVSGGYDSGNSLATAEALGTHWHECNATAPGGCTVCAACCKSDIAAGGACAACFAQHCTKGAAIVVA